MVEFNFHPPKKSGTFTEADSKYTRNEKLENKIGNSDIT